MPTDPWSSSDASPQALQRLVDEGLLCPVTNRDRSEWITSLPIKREPCPRKGYVVSFLAFHERGFGMPPSRFMRSLPYYYGVDFHNFAPNSLSQEAIFAVVCEGYLGIPPHWELWLHLFRGSSTPRRRP